jgi:hypothetical protein
MLLHSSRPAACLVIALSTACAKEAPPPQEARTVEGECADVYGGQVCTWATIDATDRVTEFGATIPLATIEGAPAEMEMAWPPLAQASLALPEAVRAATGMQHFTVNWEAGGHPPGPYLTPHFDFHFYSIPATERMAIDCTDTTKPATLPVGYALEDPEVPGLGVLVGTCVPQMGMHSLPADEMGSTEVFSATMVMGYYRGKPIFVEPMLARAKLLERASFELPMPTIEGAPADAVPPKGMVATYDAEANAYRIAFAVP